MSKVASGLTALRADAIEEVGISTEALDPKDGALEDAFFPFPPG